METRISFLVLLETETLKLRRVNYAMSDHEQIESTIKHYFQGHATGDASHMRLAFLPSARVEGIRQGQFASWSFEEYCALFSGNPAADELERQRTLDRVDIFGSVAIAVATLVHGATTFTDVFALHKLEQGWKISNKSYHVAQN